jgi:HAMP domain-containing protein
LLIPLVAIGLLALVDTWREAVQTANTVSDRVLAGSALAIAERVVVAEDGSLEVDIPYVALEMLTSAAQDRVFYRVDGPPGAFITGYQELPVLEGSASNMSEFGDGEFRGEDIRIARLARTASTGISSIPFVVTVAETKIARTQLAEAILLRSAIRLGILIGAAALIIWVAVTASLAPLYRLRDAIAERNPDDLHPIDRNVPSEVVRSHRHGELVHGAARRGDHWPAQFHRQCQPPVAHTDGHRAHSTRLGLPRAVAHRCQSRRANGGRGDRQCRARAGAIAALGAHRRGRFAAPAPEPTRRPHGRRA